MDRPPGSVRGGGDPVPERRVKIPGRQGLLDPAPHPPGLEPRRHPRRGRGHPATDCRQEHEADAVGPNRDR